VNTDRPTIPSQEKGYLMSDMEVNIPLLRKAVEWAEVEAAKPIVDRQWEQLHYRWEAVDALRAMRGSWFSTDIPNYEERLTTQRSCGTAYCIAGYIHYVLIGNEPAFAYSSSGDVAMEALGITEAQAEELFHASNSITDVRRIAEDIAGERL
jgi:hypothetical protein